MRKLTIEIEWLAIFLAE